MANNEITVSAGGSKIDINITKDLSAYYAMLSKEWAIKSNGTVDGTDYSAKYYANMAQSEADRATNVVDSSLLEIEQATNESLTKIDEASTPVLENLDTVSVVSENIDDVINIADNLDNILNKTVQIGKTTTGEAGTNASVTNSGTALNPVLDFVIPKGAKGDNGGLDMGYDAENQAVVFSYVPIAEVVATKLDSIIGEE